MAKSTAPAWKQKAKDSRRPVPRRTNDLSIQQAADLLNILRPFLVKLLDDKEMPHHNVGAHPRGRSARV
ncbi:MAG: excisionase family DNA-binding protein [Alphaproteobacteria bacterium]|nr:excisionase family DNA-binding protein [Alphaproteobacteria bacterium]